MCTPLIYKGETMKKSILKVFGFAALMALGVQTAVAADDEVSVKIGEIVTLRGFGTFGIKHRAAKAARNITKNTTIQVPERDVPHFKPSKDFTL